MEAMELKANGDAEWKMGRILLRYRPIAPKPIAPGAVPGVVAEPTQPVGMAKKRNAARRKNNNSGGSKRGRKLRKVEPVDKPHLSGSSCTAPVVTLPLMPVTPERTETCWITGASAFCWPLLPVAGLVVSPRAIRASTMSVTVESVTGAWSLEFYASTRHDDDELKRWLEVSDCPAFISKASSDRVTWTNAAYRRMVVGGGLSADQSPSSSSSHSSTMCSDASSLPEAAVVQQVRVELLTRGLVPGYTCRTFTCMTSVRYSCERQRKVSLAVPCDVWRLEDGNLAWRLDIKAALSLSTGY